MTATATTAATPQRRAGARRDGPRRITFVSTALMQGGAEHQVALLASGLAARDWDVTVVSMRPPEAHVETLENSGVRVVSLDMARRFPDPRAVFRLARDIHADRPDVVHAHMVHANLLARVTRLAAPIPVLVSTAHNISEGPRWREFAYRLTDPLGDLTTNVSHAAVQRYIDVGAVPAHKIRCVPNGIDFTRFQPSALKRRSVREALGVAEDRPLLLAVGRFEPAKDHATMLQAFRRVLDARPNALLLLVGAGSLEADVRALAASLGLQDAVRFLGLRTDVPDLMNAADLYLMSSSWEGLPLVLLEAAASGLPIVATDVGGNTEIVQSGVNGMMVPPHEVAQLADAVEQVLAMPPEQLRAWGQAGRAHVEQTYDIEKVLSQWETVYEEIWRRKSGARALGTDAG